MDREFSATLQYSTIPVLHFPESTLLTKFWTASTLEISLMSIRPSDESNRKGERPL
jgi:hypothetical protein